MNKPTLDRIPPHSMVAEQSVIGSILTYPDTFDQWEPTGLSAHWFYDLRNRTIFETIVAERAASRPVDTVAIAERLRSDQILEGIGGWAYLSEITGNSFASQHYVDILRESYTLRQLLANCTEIVCAIHEGPEDVASLLDQAERGVLAVRESVIQSPKESTPKERAAAFIPRLEERFKVQEGIATGFSKLDWATGGMRPGNMIVVAARANTGKTAFAANIADYVGRNHGPVGFVSLEMTEGEIHDRLVSTAARVNVSAIGPLNCPSDEEWRSITIANTRSVDSRIWIDDRGGLTIGAIRAKARRWKKQHGIVLLVIDYLQLIRSEAGTRSNDRRVEVDGISRAIKELSKELKIPVLVLAQLNRDIEKDKARKPRLADLRESGAIEQDADTVAMLYSVDDVEENPRENQPQNINLALTKQRHGRRGMVVQFRFDGQFSMFTEISPIAP